MAGIPSGNYRPWKYFRFGRNEKYEFFLPVFAEIFCHVSLNLFKIDLYLKLIAHHGCM